MQMKKLVLASLLACGMVSYASQLQHPFATGIEVIDTLEAQKFQDYQQKEQALYADELGFEQLRQRIMGKVMVVLLTVSQEMSLDDVETKEDICDYIKLVCGAIRQDDDYTPLVQNLVDFCEEYGCEFVIQHYDRITEVIAAQQIQGLSWADALGLFKEYIPHDVDMLCAYIDWYTWQKDFYEQQLEKNNKLTFEDVYYAAAELGVKLKLPEVTMNVWLKLLQACKDGSLDLPQEVSSAILQSLTDDVHNDVLQTVIVQLKQIAHVRKELVALSSDLTDDHVAAYAQMLDNMFANKLLFDQSKKEDMFLLQEKIIFKN